MGNCPVSSGESLRGQNYICQQAELTQFQKLENWREIGLFHCLEDRKKGRQKLNIHHIYEWMSNPLKNGCIMMNFASIFQYKHIWNQIGGKHCQHVQAVCSVCSGSVCTNEGLEAELREALDGRNQPATNVLLRCGIQGLNTRTNLFLMQGKKSLKHTRDATLNGEYVRITFKLFPRGADRVGHHSVCKSGVHHGGRAPDVAGPQCYWQGAFLFTFDLPPGKMAPID